MKRYGPILISVAVWGLIVAYIVWSSELGRIRRSQTLVSSVSVNVIDSSVVHLVDGKIVEGWLAEAGADPIGSRVGEIDRYAVNAIIQSKPYVKESWTWVDLDGTVNISLYQRYPVARVIAPGGYDFYITSDHYILPAAGYPPQFIPVVTGEFGLPFDIGFEGGFDSLSDGDQKKSDKNYIFLSKLINFVNYIISEDFWRSQIVQINVGQSSFGTNGDYYVTLIPRLGDHVIELGPLDGYRNKLHRLMVFYRQAVPAEGWSKWNNICLEYDGQVVCR